MVKKKDNFRGLRNFNLVLAIAYFLQAIAVIVWAKPATVPLFSGHAAFDELSGGLAPAARHLFDIKLSYLLILMLVIAGLFHLLQATIKRKAHEAALKKKISRGRWIEFGLAASLMVWVLGLLGGINELSLLILIAGFVAVSKFFSYRMELTFIKDKKPSWMILWLGLTTGGLALLPLLIYKTGTFVFGQTGLPRLLHWAFLTTLLTFAAFVAVEIKYYKKSGRWSDYLYADRAYSLIYLFGQTALTWLIFAGFLR